MTETHGSLRDVLPLAEAQEKIRQERKGLRDLMVTKADRFKLTVSKTGVDEEGKPKKVYGLDLEGKAVPFSPEGIEGLCRLLKMDFKYFSDYPREAEFLEHVQTLLPKVIRETGGVLVRYGKNGGQVRGVCPGNYTILDDEQMLELLGGIAAQTLQKLKGVQVCSSYWNASIYRLVFGDSAFARDEIYPTLTIRNSEIGGPLALQFGTLRIRCLNGSIDTTKVGTVLNWGHRGSFDKQVTKIGQTLRTAADRLVPAIQSLRNAQTRELEHPGEELHKLLRAGWINQSFHDQAEGVLSAQLTKGEKFGSVSPKSKYAVFNALTSTTKLYRPKMRARWEAMAHDYLLLK